MSAPVERPQALPTYADRLQGLGARRAFFAHVCEEHTRQFAGVPIEGWLWRPIAMCSGCGTNTSSWCDSCELRQLGFATVFGQVMVGTPLCGQCETDERCRVCSGEEEPMIRATGPDVPVVVINQREATPEEVVPPFTEDVPSGGVWTVGWRVCVRTDRDLGLIGGCEGCVVDGSEAGLVRIFEHEETFQCYQLLPSNLVVTDRNVVGRVTPLDILKWDHLHRVPRQPETEWLRRDPLTWTEAQLARATVTTVPVVVESARRRGLIGGLSEESAMAVARHVLRSHHDPQFELALSRPFEPYQGVLLRTTFAGWRARRGWKRLWARIRGFLATSHLLEYLRQQATLGESFIPLADGGGHGGESVLMKTTFYNNILYGRADMVGELLREFPSLAHSHANGVQDGGMRSPPLLFAVKYFKKLNRLRVLRVLLDGGCGVDATDRVGGTALLAAVAQGYVGCARLLIQHGADKSRCVDMGHGLMTANDIAQMYGSHEMRRLLSDLN